METNLGKVKLNKPSRSASSVERGQNSRLNIEIFAKSFFQIRVRAFCGRKTHLSPEGGTLFWTFQDFFRGEIK